MPRNRIALNGDIGNVAGVNLRRKLRKINLIARGIAARALKNIEQGKQHQGNDDPNRKISHSAHDFYLSSIKDALLAD